MPTSRAMIAEFIGTFTLMFMGGGAILVGGDLPAVALAHGLALAVMISATMHISGGQFNPAVSVGVALMGKQSWPQAVTFMIAQVLGSVVAALLLKTLLASLPDMSIVKTATLGARGLSAGPVFVLETIATFFLVFVVLGSAVDSRSLTRPTAGFAIGLTVAGCILAIGPLTGASMNPARSLGPQIVSGAWGMAWVYWIAPVTGGVLAALVHRLAFAARPSTA